MDRISCIVESPKGSGSRFCFDPKSGGFRLAGTLPAGLVFPFDFGFIPGTHIEDGGRIGAIIISETCTFTGCSLDCRVIGAIRATGKEHGSVIVIPELSLQYGGIRSLSGFPAHVIRDVQRFFINYNAQSGKTSTSLRLLGVDAALKLIRRAQDAAVPTQLIQLLLPLFDNSKKPFPERLYTAVKKKLTGAFGGVTIYSQAPATGLWKNEADNIVTDRLIVFEVMTSHIDTSFWKAYKVALMKTFKQDEIMIRRTEIGLL